MHARVITVAFGIMVLLAWEVATCLGIIHPLVLPAPSAVFVSVRSVVGSPLFLVHFATTLLEIGVGFLIACVVGCFVALLVSISSMIRHALYPYIVALQAPPKILLVPMFLTWFGFGISSKIAMASTIAFFPMFVNAYTGFSNLERDHAELFRAFAATRWQLLWKVQIPNALPFILSGVKLSWTLSVVGVMVAEFVGARRGLGYLIQSYNFQLKIPQAFVVIGLLGMVTIGVYGCIERVEKRLIFWIRDPGEGGRRSRGW